MIAITSPKVGQSVQIDPTQAGKWVGVTFTIKSIGRTNALLSVPGSERGLRCPLAILVEPVAPEEARRAEFELLTTDLLNPGALVRVKGRPGLWVVTKMTRSLHYQAVRLGGDGGRYLTNIARSTMTVVDSGDVERIEAEYAV